MRFTPLLLVTLLTSLAQSRPEPSLDEMQVHDRYSFLFFRLETLEMLANRVEAAGKDPRRTTRLQVKNEAGLTDAEDNAVRTAARSARADQLVIGKRRGDTIRAFKAANPKQTDPPDAIKAQLLDADRKMMWLILDKVKEIRTA